MTLVPIIYTSLLIFSGLLLFVIIVSYISFKMKGENRPVRHSVQSNPQPAMAIRAVKTTPTIQLPLKEYAREINPVQRAESGRNSYQYRNSDAKSNITKSESRKPEQVLQNLSSNRHTYEKSRKIENTSRIEIMNSSEKYHQPSFYQESPAYNKSSQRLTDLNLINCYSDRNDTGFVSLTTL